MDKKILITIGREYGSGGYEIAEKLSKILKIPMYDKNILKIAAEKTGISTAVLEDGDERISNPFAEPFIPYGLDTGSISERLFTLQSTIIKEKAEEGSGIFLGRCSDDILKDYEEAIHIFIFAPFDYRVARIMRTEQIEYESAAIKIVKRTDKQRKTYYQYYTDNKWGSYQGKDLIVNSSKLGIDGTVQLILSYLEAF